MVPAELVIFTTNGSCLLVASLVHGRVLPSTGSIHLGTRDILGCTKRLKRYPFQAYQLNTNTGILLSNSKLFDQSRFPRKVTEYCKYFTNYQQIHEIFTAKFYNYSQTHIFMKICDHGNLQPYGNYKRKFPPN